MLDSIEGKKGKGNKERVKEAEKEGEKRRKSRK
jgi:hypothetical protein